MSRRTLKTFNDDYGSHALVYSHKDAFPQFGRTDVVELLWMGMTEHDGVHPVHPTRRGNDYEPRHAKSEIKVGESIYAQTQAQANELNRWIETGESPAQEKCGHNNQFLRADGSTIECADCGTIWDTGARL